MPNVQIREVPDDVHNELVRRAELAGQSLQQYLSAQLASIAATPTGRSLQSCYNDFERSSATSMTQGSKTIRISLRRLLDSKTAIHCPEY